MNLPSFKQLKRLKHLSVVLLQKTVRNVHAIVGIDADQVGVEGCVWSDCGKPTKISKPILYVRVARRKLEPFAVDLFSCPVRFGRDG